MASLTYRERHNFANREFLLRVANVLLTIRSEVNRVQPSYFVGRVGDLWGRKALSRVSPMSPKYDGGAVECEHVRDDPGHAFWVRGETRR